ncbi:TPA: helix-turn-helix transcriptional regulator [Bacillus thuringiensis]|uniref:Transcriptional regulator n=1 Tax=Bacillus thuringiensis TaxID=1428 RepID=A0A9X6Q8B5_BACTU|nr:MULTISPECIES: helix-turn-helix transcriptional regulator [Bacillus cereus group]NIE93080.1 helix-turn-helix transcriptional regulator [Bacillus sp. Ab-1751]AJA23173.1 XRE family transcriptional regulator [Bacillus thuringiensis serovar galleriae]ETE94400.1 XRE family transcriptional regulator [Bacillus thuringiensis serovar aizawai str. Leapi01]ETE96897.1 XRE family transcriptional regulator [Bacillus thuringiensis serovar aizawai str. Hu4-2]KAB1375211.1 helix-turn-helix transcriptional reg
MNYERVAENLINLRNGRSREEVARAVGISVSTLQMYENGQRIPRDNIKIKLANFYGVTVQTIFFDSGQHEVC